MTIFLTFNSQSTFVCHDIFLLRPPKIICCIGSFKIPSTPWFKQRAACVSCPCPWLITYRVLMPLIDRENQIETIQLICIYIGRFSISNVFDHLFTHQLFSVPLSICTWVAENGCRAQCDSVIDCFSSEDVLELYCNCKPAGPQTVHISIFSNARDVVLGTSVLLPDGLAWNVSSV